MRLTGFKLERVGITRREEHDETLLGEISMDAISFVCPCPAASLGFGFDTNHERVLMDREGLACIFGGRNVKEMDMDMTYEPLL